MVRIERFSTTEEDAMTSTQLFGLCSMVLAMAAFAIYFITMLRGETKPSRSVWLIYCLLDVILIHQYTAEGVANENILLIFGFAAANTMIVVASLWLNTGVFSNREKAELVFCGLAAICSFFYPACSTIFFYAYYALIGCELSRKTWSDPNGESLLAWGTFALSDIANMAVLFIQIRSGQEMGLLDILTPTTLFLESGGISAIIFCRRRALRHAIAPSL